MYAKRPQQSFERLQAALATLYVEPQPASLAFKNDLAAALQRFTDNPASFGRLRMGPLFVRRQTREVAVAARKLLKPR